MSLRNSAAEAKQLESLRFLLPNSTHGAPPKQIRIASYIVIISGFVTAVELLIKAFFPAIDAALGLFIPLIVVNCIILGRAESFACKNNVLDSALDGIGIGLGFTIGLTLLGICRELLGNGTVFGASVIPADYSMLLFILPPGAFLTLGYIIAIINKMKK